MIYIIVSKFLVSPVYSGDYFKEMEVNNNAERDSNVPDLTGFKTQGCSIANATQNLWKTMVAGSIERSVAIATLREEAQTIAENCYHPLEARALYHEALRSLHFLNDIYLKRWVQLADLEAMSDETEYIDLIQLQEKINNSPLSSFAYSFYISKKQKLIASLKKNEDL